MSENCSIKVSNKYFPPKIKFTIEEDLQLASLVNEFGENDWKLISDKIQTRTSRQCRERWINYINPKLKNEPWTDEEDILLLKKYKEFGPKWHYITEFFPNRGRNHVKNRWHSLQKSSKHDYKKIIIPKLVEDQKDDNFSFLDKLIKPKDIYSWTNGFSDIAANSGDKNPEIQINPSFSFNPYLQ